MQTSSLNFLLTFNNTSSYILSTFRIIKGSFKQVPNQKPRDYSECHWRMIWWIEATMIFFANNQNKHVDVRLRTWMKGGWDSTVKAIALWFWDQNELVLPIFSLHFSKEKDSSLKPDSRDLTRLWGYFIHTLRSKDNICYVIWWGVRLSSPLRHLRLQPPFLHFSHFPTFHFSFTSKQPICSILSSGSMKPNNF